ncbi:putative fungal-specific transcription factor [Halenospora varia]|nr:putative fungal-specific transcription factor [Halenospora varia]
MSTIGEKRSYEAMQSSPEPNPDPSSSEKRAAKVSKTVTACTECQKRKIKCDIDVATGKEVCGRCEKKGLQCVVNKSLQTLLKEETQWKKDMEHETRVTREAVSEILRVLNLPPLNTFGQPCSTSTTRRDMNITSPRNERAMNVVRFPSELSSPANSMGARRPTAAMAMTRENSQEPDHSDQKTNTIVTDPMGSLYEVTKLRNLRSNPQSKSRQYNTSMDDDFISCGRVSIQDAEQLFQHFSKYLNAYLWGGIALVHSNLTAVRQSSSLLLAAILTVSALHVPGMEEVFDVCYAEFVELICDSMLDKYHTLDGVRGLTIGAFWLSDLSWKLSGHAVRIATELNLHQSYSKLMKGHSEHFEAARLWYFLYVCDHHFSIAYGRPPVIHENSIIVSHVKFLQLPQATQADQRLHSQVAVFVILTDIYNTFGPDIEEHLTENDLIYVRNFNLRLDQWRSEWQERLAPNPHIGKYPSKGVTLHYHYAKLQLNSLSLRGLKENSESLSTTRREFARTATASAEMLLRMTLEEPDIRNAIVGVPLYLLTMITYATVFLLKVQQKWRGAQIGMDLLQIQDLVSRVINQLQNAKASQRHLTYHIANGLSKMLGRFTAVENRESGAVSVVNQDVRLGPNHGYRVPENGDIGGFEPHAIYGDMAGYDQYFPFGFFDVLSSTMPEWN